MTISILIRAEGQKIARPFNRACSMEEMDEIITHFLQVQKMTMTSVAVSGNFGTDEPIVRATNGALAVEFYAFMEP